MFWRGARGYFGDACRPRAAGSPHRTVVVFEALGAFREVPAALRAFCKVPGSSSRFPRSARKLTVLVGSLRFPCAVCMLLVPSVSLTMHSHLPLFPWVFLLCVSYLCLPFLARLEFWPWPALPCAGAGRGGCTACHKPNRGREARLLMSKRRARLPDYADQLVFEEVGRLCNRNIYSI